MFSLRGGALLRGGTLLRARTADGGVYISSSIDGSGRKEKILPRSLSLIRIRLRS
jgi:hypothetical protein